jgi:hypothetical protein
MLATAELVVVLTARTFALEFVVLERSTKLVLLFTARALTLKLVVLVHDSMDGVLVLAARTLAVGHVSRATRQRGTACKTTNRRHLGQLLFAVELRVAVEVEGRPGVEELPRRRHPHDPIRDRVGLSLERIIGVADLELRHDPKGQVLRPRPPHRRFGDPPSVE